MDVTFPLRAVATLTTTKVVSLYALVTGLFAASDIPDPQLKEWTMFGVGGLLAAMIFHFYRQDRLASQAREEQYAKQLMEINATIITVVKENSEVITGLHETVNVLHTTMAEMNRELRDSMRDGGRRAYDPPNVQRDR